MNMSFQIARCPSCGSRKIRRVRKDLHCEYRGQKKYDVPQVEFYACPDCKERVFSPEAMRAIYEVSPAYRKTRYPAR